MFGYQVSDLGPFDVVEFDETKKVYTIKEKPNKPKSNYAVTGLYFYDNQATNIAKNIQPSDRCELEITAVNQHYLKNYQLYVEDFGRGFAWLDTGTLDSLMEAGQFIRTIEHRQGLKGAYLKEITCRNEWISAEKLIEHGSKIIKTKYGRYLIVIGRELY